MPLRGLRREMVGAGAARRRARLAARFAAATERRISSSDVRPVEPHAALRRVHRLGDAEAELPEMLAVGDGARPSRSRRRATDRRRRADRRPRARPRTRRGSTARHARRESARRATADTVSSERSALRQRGSTRPAQGGVRPVHARLLLRGCAMLSGGTSTQRRSFQLCSAHSTSCTPLAPSSSVYRYGASSDDVADEHLPLRLEAVVVGVRCPAPAASRRRNRSSASRPGSRPAAASPARGWIMQSLQARRPPSRACRRPGTSRGRRDRRASPRTC